ncbi:hypothetical protein BE18_34655 [Sorangium cellulosum]|uniref:Uncharacterized protein n=1 Tax=Sorangium cellulosum TaxID=56 RepID=A0A150RRU5_SORCE|nr:hypothetical protein BE18_34655 [Sorangium cellulosum]
MTAGSSGSASPGSSWGAGSAGGRIPTAVGDSSGGGRPVLGGAGRRGTDAPSSSRTRSTSCRICADESKRLRRSQASALSTRPMTEAGSSGAIRASDGAGVVAARMNASLSERPWCRRCPLSTAYRVAPIEKRSARPSTPSVSPIACSGAMNDGVPSAVPALVLSPGAPRSLATPKSSSFTTLSFVMKMFAGFRSRWTMPSAWKLSSVLSTSPAIQSASATGSFRLLRFQSCCTVSPSSSSMTRNGSSCSVMSSSRIATRPG